MCKLSLHTFANALTNKRTLIAAATLIVSTACTLNPATGKRQLSLIGEQQEIAMGREYDKGVTAEFGLYPDQELQEYVQEIGHRMAAASERPNLPWEFKVVDDDAVNAFAVPGGYIYMTRGILAYFNSEAQLATVMGHEIGHVTARHSVEQMSRAQLAQLGVGIATVASEEFRQYSGLAELGLGVLFLKFSRDDESQSDDLGLRYLLRTGYDPNEAPRVFEMLERHGDAQGQARLPEWQATHPSPDRRAARLTDMIRTLPPEQQTGTIDRQAYLNQLRGLKFGVDPRQGYVVGSTFMHPDMAFRMDFPKDWKIVNQRQLVAGVSPNQDAFVVLTLAQGDSPREAEQTFFAQEGIRKGQQWRKGFRQFEVVPQADPAGNTGIPIRGTVGFKAHKGTVFRLICYTSADKLKQYNQPMHQSLPSFRNLTEPRFLNVQSKKIKIVKLPKSMTLEQFNRQNPSTIDLETLAVLNGVNLGTALPKGTMVKQIVGKDPPTR